MNLKSFYNLNKEKNLIEKNDKIIIAMSGGPDSLFLYYLLKKIKREYNLTIYFAHVNHSLRGQDSDNDEQFVINLGKSEKIKTFNQKINLKKFAKENKLSEEEAGREIRYGFFRKIKEKIGANKVALAHNEDDIVETFMFRLIRGTSINGLKSIPSKREFFVRPILKYRKDSILNYLDKNKIPYCIDKTNFKDIYTRNKIRLNLIPSIEEEYNPNFKEKIINLISDIENFDEIISSNLKKHLKNDILSISLLKSEKNFIQSSIISKYLQRYKISVNRNKIKEIQNLIYAKGTKEIHCNSEFLIKKSYDKLIILRKEEKEKYKFDKLLEKKINIPGSTIWNNYKINANIIKEKEPLRKNEKTFYCRLKEGENLNIRSRRGGDKIFPEGMNGRKKIKDLFIDLKIPKEERDHIPIITNFKEILWVCGIKKDKRFNNVLKKGQLIKLEYEKLEEVDFSGKQ